MSVLSARKFFAGVVTENDNIEKTADDGAEGEEGEEGEIEGQCQKCHLRTDVRQRISKLIYQLR